MVICFYLWSLQFNLSEKKNLNFSIGEGIGEAARPYVFPLRCAKYDEPVMAGELRHEFRTAGGKLYPTGILTFVDAYWLFCRADALRPVFAGIISRRCPDSMPTVVITRAKLLPYCYLPTRL